MTEAEKIEIQKMIDDAIQANIPWINSPLLNGDISILDYSNHSAQLADHESRISALENI